MYLIKSLTEQEKFDEALEIVARWKTLSPQNPATYHVQAQIMLAKRDGNAAVMALRQALKISPNFPPAYELLGDICFGARKPEEAERFWNKTLELQPGSDRVKEKLKKLEEAFPGTVATDTTTTPSIEVE